MRPRRGPGRTFLTAGRPRGGAGLEVLEHRSIALACHETLSVAELAARVDLPLGVTRVLVGDLATHGVVTVHRAPSHAGGPNVALLEQVLHGLQRL
jgi:Protein of unknown function (DUF742)